MSIVEIPIVRYENGSHSSTRDIVAAEEPLEIFVDDKPFHTTMRLPGEEIPLAVGFLFTEGLIDSANEILTASYCGDVSTNRITIRLKSRANPDTRRNFTGTYTSYSSCGICGRDMVSDLLKTTPKITKSVTVSVSRLAEFLSTFTGNQQVYRDTGGTHGAAIFGRDGEMLAFSEDIGRHNALDKSIGKVVLARKISEAKVLILSSRLSYEMVSKAARLGIEIIAGVSSATSLAIEVAKNLNITLIGFYRRNRGNIYTCPDRVTFEDKTLTS